MKKIIVQKFGGTSVGSPERIKAVAEICKNTKEKEDCNLVVVVSAMGDTTDDLCDLMDQTTKNASDRDYDMLLSSGEQVSISLLSMALAELGVSGLPLLGWQAGIKTNSMHKKARIDQIDCERIHKAFQNNEVPVVAGFQGISEDGEVTTLGRGGSDTTAVALAVALKAERCDIYTDVDSVHTTDPRIVKGTGSLKSITYDEMLELASLGAKVLHPRSVEIARNYNMPMRVRSSWKPENEGTLITKTAKDNQKNKGENMIEGQRTVRGVALDKKHARLSIIGVPDEPGIAYKIFGQLAEKGISIDIIVQCASQDNVAELDFTVDLDDAERAKKELDTIAQNVKAKETTLDTKIVKVSAVGAGMIDQPGVAAKMFRALADKKINIHMISTSEIRISCIVDEENGELAVQTIHDAFNLEKVSE